MASVANHTCLTTNGGTNGTVVVDLSSGLGKANNNGALRGNNYNRERNKTIPLLHVHAHHHHHSHHNNHNLSHHHHHHSHNHHNHNNHLVHNNSSNGSATNNGGGGSATNTTGPVGVVSPNITIATTGSGPIATSMINNSNGRAHVGRRVSSPVGPT